MNGDFSNFLNRLWSDVEKITDADNHNLQEVYGFMEHCDGKPPMQFVEFVYDQISGTESRAVYSHSLPFMLPRIIDSSEWVFSHLSDNKRILDLGTNTAHNLIWWASKFEKSKFFGIDISSNSINVANLWRKKANTMNVSLYVGNILEPIPELVEQKFDIIINSFTIETIPDLSNNNWRIPNWIIDSMNEDSIFISCMTVPNWNRLATIINQWRSQGLNLHFLDLFPTGGDSSHPYLIFRTSGVDNYLDVDIPDFMMERIELLHG